MSRSALAAGVHFLRHIAAAQRYREDSDEQLLHAFAEQRDENAFAVLVRRHGPMVLHVCRRVLGQEQDAEDAFQATFLVLARNACSLRKKSSLASFLHGTAYRLALRAKRAAARRRKHEGRAAVRSSPGPAEELSWREMRALLDEEIARLPEKYRSVFILCCLEELSRAEVGRCLGLTERTVLSRLAEARKRLRQRLARRGVELTALLVAAALATGPMPLAANPTQAVTGLVSPHVSILAKSAAPTAFSNKTLIGATVLLAASVWIGVGAWSASANRLPFNALTPPPASQPQPTQANQRSDAERGKEKAAAQTKKSETLTVQGRVLGPDGRPVQGARLYAAGTESNWPRGNADVALAQPEPTGADGRFRIAVHRPGPDEYVYLIAHAAGCGVDWIDVSQNEGRQEVTLRLPKDVPITGRVVNTEGRPVAGASVSIATIWAFSDANPDSYLAGWLRNFRVNYFAATPKWLMIPLDAITGKATTDKDGQFTLRGAGSERIVHVAFSGAGVARTTPWILTRPGFDPKPYNAVLRNQENAFLLKFNRFPGLFAPSFTFIAEAGKTIEGVVKDAATGKPLPGCRLSTQTSYGHGIAVVSDAEGKYRIDGLAKRADGHFLSIRPHKGTDYLGRSMNVPDSVGYTAIRLDIELAKGAIITGRVTDKQTGKGVRCFAQAVPLPGNKFFGAKPGFDGTAANSGGIGEGGRFRIVAIPGRSLLMVRVIEGYPSHGEPVNVYRRAVPDPNHKDLFTRSGESWRIATASSGLEFLDGENAVKVIDVKEKGETRVELSVDRGTTIRIIVQDAEGKPLSGAWVAGLEDVWPRTHHLPEATATVYALHPNKLWKVTPFPSIVHSLSYDKPRRLAFFHAEKKLGGTATVRGDEKGPIVVSLAPLGKVSGRLLDTDGNPLEGVDVTIFAQSRVGRELYSSAASISQPAHTDKEGRFRIEGIVPGLMFQLSLRKERTYLVGEPRIGVRRIQAGESLDLGDVRVKPSR